jgi:DNA-binding protein H-NS
MGRLGGGNRSAFMESNTFESMSIDGLSSLHEQLTSILARKIEEEKARLEERLRSLNINKAISPDRPRRPYPKVLPKYRNPRNPAETWSGRGKQPHWVQAQLRAGKKLDHLLINRSSIERRRQAV